RRVQGSASPGSERRNEAKFRHLRFPSRDCEFARHDGVLSSIGIRWRARGGGSERVCTKVPALALGAFHRTVGNWILAATPCQAMLGETELFERRVSLGGSRA